MAGFSPLRLGEGPGERLTPQHAGKPPAHEGGQRGVHWGKAPMAGGLGDVPPKTSKGGELPTLTNPPRVGPKTPANPQPTRAGKRGVQGGVAPWRGLWGCPPQTQKRERVAHISNPAASGTQDAGKPSAYGGGQGGAQGGEAPMAGGLGDVPPKTSKGGELPTLATSPRVGPKTPANPQPTGVGKTGSQVGEAPWQGIWGMCPQKPQKGASCPH